MSKDFPLKRLGVHMNAEAGNAIGKIVLENTW